MKCLALCFVFFSVITYASTETNKHAPWASIKTLPSEAKLAKEILLLETSGYRSGVTNGEKCRQQDSYQYIKSKAPFVVSEAPNEPAVNLKKLPEIIKIIQDANDSSVRWIVFKDESGNEDRVSFAINNESLWKKNGFAKIIAPASSKYIRIECIENE